MWSRHSSGGLVFDKGAHDWAHAEVELEGRGRIIDLETGEEVWRSEEWRPNAYNNDGKTNVLNVYYRENAHASKYLTLATNGSITDTTAMTAVTEPSGITRQQMLAASWTAPSDPGDGNRQISHPELTFANASGGAWSVTYVVGTTTLTGTGGLLLFYIAQAATVNNGQEFRFTIRQKSRN